MIDTHAKWRNALAVEISTAQAKDSLERIPDISPLAISRTGRIAIATTKQKPSEPTS